ncbi:hypothetical protein KFK09_019708 [Dendrobium nobile]|uniref:Uncharacterized protein n=1 Tax=Dendrobium nobile TaxID=94219 RepID=A0A8T3AQX5_DENNO|nr:hypothetical protein KFK09_019708 [Dendrobium nobile]
MNPALDRRSSTPLKANRADTSSASSRSQISSIPDISTRESPIFFFSPTSDLLRAAQPRSPIVRAPVPPTSSAPISSNAERERERKRK